MNSLRDIFGAPLVLAAMMLAGGCQSDMVNTPEDSPRLQHVSKQGAATRTSLRSSERKEEESVVARNCSSSSGLLLPLVGLSLTTNTSSVTYPVGVINLPTAVSFGICSVDSGGPGVQKTQAFGPVIDLLFLGRVSVDLSLDDAGLPASTPDFANFRVLRQDEATGTWLYHASGSINGGRVRYEVSVNGTYIVSLLSFPVLDTLWTITGLISPQYGGTLHLLNSSLVVAPGALLSTTNFSWTIASRVPQGLPGALRREYEFGPEGTTFQIPVNVYISFADAALEGNDPYQFQFYYYDPESNAWVIQSRKVDLTNERFVVRLQHFSRYAFGR